MIALRDCLMMWQMSVFGGGGGFGTGRRGGTAMPCAAILSQVMRSLLRRSCLYIYSTGDVESVIIHQHQEHFGTSTSTAPVTLQLRMLLLLVFPLLLLLQALHSTCC